MTNIIYQMETISCPSCINKIQNALGKTKGVKEVEVLFNSSRVKASFDELIISADDIKAKIEALGYTVLSQK